MKEYIAEQEWEEFEPSHNLSPDISGKLWNNINKNTASPAVRHSYFKWITAAAAVLFVAGLSWQYISTGQKTSSAVMVATTDDIVNTTPQKMGLTLSDGSSVDLLPHSKLSYVKDFNSVKREVVLKGEATFDITKDVAKPFSVYSNSVLITVLGTRFTVNSYDPDQATKVILQAGKVMVRVADSSFQGNKELHYLNPGDIFIYKKGVSARVFHLEKEKDDCYQFRNYPLDVVFDQLQLIYNTKITYDRTELGNRTFIGKIDKKDSLYHLLQSIVLLNNFKLHKQGDSLVVN